MERTDLIQTITNLTAQVEKLTKLITEKDAIINQLLEKLDKPSTYTAEKQPENNKKWKKKQMQRT